MTFAYRWYAHLFIIDKTIKCHLVGKQNPFSNTSFEFFPNPMCSNWAYGKWQPSRSSAVANSNEALSPCPRQRQAFASSVPVVLQCLYFIIPGVSFTEATAKRKKVCRIFEYWSSNTLCSLYFFASFIEQECSIKSLHLHEISYLVVKEPRWDLHSVPCPVCLQWCDETLCRRSWDSRRHPLSLKFVPLIRNSGPLLTAICIGMDRQQTWILHRLMQWSHPRKF